MAMSLGKKSSGFDDDDMSYTPMAEINVTPMVDVMLVLLIIFMVAAPLMVQGVPVNLPKTSATKLGSVKKPMVVTMDGDGNLYIRDEQVTRQNLLGRLLEIRAQEGADNIVYVRADKKISYGDVMELLGSVGQSGFARVSLLSQPAPSSGAAGNP